jgi:2-dehydro-3-deoxy-D-arabinonate dehydratase
LKPEESDLKLIHYFLPGRGAVWGLAERDRVYEIASSESARGSFLSTLLQWPDPVSLLRQTWPAISRGESVSLPRLLDAAAGGGEAHLLAPIDHQEVWAAGVTYERSKAARMEESEAGSSFYDRVYDAERPELFLKATPSRVAGSNGTVRIRRDARWNVPEPELALLVTPQLRIVGYTVGNDMSARDMEGENPLYLPQAKIYRDCCALGPVILLEEEWREHRVFDIQLRVLRGGEVVASGSASTAQMKRQFIDLLEFLGRDNLFPDGAFLLTGTGIVPEEDFSLAAADLVEITVPEIGLLRSTVVQGR